MAHLARRHHRQALGLERVHRFCVVPEVCFATDDNVRHLGAILCHFRYPLAAERGKMGWGMGVLEGVGRKQARAQCRAGVESTAANAANIVTPNTT